MQVFPAPRNTKQTTPIHSYVDEVCWEKNVNLSKSNWTSYDILQVTSLIDGLSKIFHVCSFCKSHDFALSKTILQHHTWILTTSHTKKSAWLDFQHVAFHSSDPKSLATAPPLIAVFLFLLNVAIPQGSFSEFFSTGIMRIKGQVAGTFVNGQ